MKKLLIAALLCLPLQTFALTHDGNLYEDALSWLRRETPSDFSERSFVLTGTSLAIYKPVVEILEAFHRQDDAETFPTFAGVCDFQVGSPDPTLCREIANPLSAYGDRGAPAMTDETMSSVEGLLATVLTVGGKTDWPAALKKVVWVRRLENLIRKVCFAEFQKRLESALKDSRLKDSTRAELAAAQSFLLDFGRISEPRGLRTLPYPLLSRDDRLVLSMLLGGVLWRFRGAGGYDDLGTRARRRLFARVPFKTLAALNGASPGLAHQIGWSTWFGLMQSWGRYHDVGRLHDTVASDFAEMKKRGEFSSRFISRLMGLYGYPEDELRSAGLQMASCYYYAWEGIDNSIKVGAHLDKPFLFIIGAPSNFGELCTGAVLATGLAKTLLTDTN